jgi:hypothetical protein
LQRLLPGTVADGGPVLAHSLERDGSRAWVAEIADELPEDVRLVGIADPPVFLLHDGFGEDIDPRPVMQRDFLERASIDLDRVFGRGRHVVRPARHNDVPAVLALWKAAALFPSTTDDAESVQRLIDHDAAALLVAGLDGQIVGSLCATWDG